MNKRGKKTNTFAHIYLHSMHEIPKRYPTEKNTGWFGCSLNLLLIIFNRGERGIIRK